MIVINDNGPKRNIYYDGNKEVPQGKETILTDEEVIELIGIFSKRFGTFNPYEVDTDGLIKYCAKLLHTTPEIMTTAGRPAGYRRKENVVAKQIAMYTLRRLNWGSLHSIGKLFNMDHASVSHALNSVENAMYCKDPLYYSNLKLVFTKYGLTDSFKENLEKEVLK